MMEVTSIAQPVEGWVIDLFLGIRTFFTAALWQRVYEPVKSRATDDLRLRVLTVLWAMDAQTGRPHPKKRPRVSFRVAIDGLDGFSEDLVAIAEGDLLTVGYPAELEAR